MRDEGNDEGTSAMRWVQVLALGTGSSASELHPRHGAATASLLDAGMSGAALGDADMSGAAQQSIL